MDIQELFGSNGDDYELPEPDVEMRYTDDDRPWTEGLIKGILCNPIYAGIGPFPAFVDDKSWVRTAAKLIEEDGKEQFLVNILYTLRDTFKYARINYGS